nr:MAG TPA: hypothetical protein [Caudoviricetes sp.]
MATVKELRVEIRKLTAEVNVRIAEYKEMRKPVRAVERQIERLQGLASTKTGKGARGEIGLGLKKSKLRLEVQKSALRNFLKFDMYSEKAKKEKKSRAQKTFERRYGKMTEAEFDQLYDTFDILRAYLADFGYEALGPSLAEQFANANEHGKIKFVDYVRRAKEKSKTGTVEDFIDVLAEEMRNDGAI